MDYRHVLQRDTVLDGKYRIERVIGAGGFGITYAALDVGLGTHVAVKEYYPAQIAMRDTTLTVRPSNTVDRSLFDHLRSSFLREARTLAQFRHPSIVGVLNVFEWHGTAYMVMRLENGPSLKAWLADLGRLPTQAELDAIAGPVLDALEVMHDADFLHRDIAPDNIIIRDDGSPVLLDFGASRRVMGAGQIALTGIVKQGYSPQEQYAGESRSQGPWTDIYATAATLYLAVTGMPPHDATQRMLEDDMPPAATAVPAGNLRPSFLSAVDWGMRLFPKDRPQSIAEWRQAMFATDVVAGGSSAGTSVTLAGSSARLAHGGTQIPRSAGSRPSHPSERLATSSRPSLPSASTPAEPAARRNHSLLLTAGVVAAVALSGMLAFGIGLVGSRPSTPIASSANTGGPAAQAGAPVQPDPRQVSAARSELDRLARDEAARKAEADRVAREAAAAAERQAAATRARDEAARKAESDRVAREAAAAAERQAAATRARDEAARKAESDRVAREAAAAAERQAAATRARDEAARKAEADRVAREAAAAAERQAAATRARDEAARKAEADRVAREAAAAAERQAAEARARDEAARKAEADRVAREAAAAAERQVAATRAREAAAAEAARKSGNDRTASAIPGTRPGTPPPDQTVLVANIRRELNRVGCLTDATSSGWVDADQKALERFAKYAGGNITFVALNGEIVETVGSYVGRVCPSQCGPGEKPEVARCVASGGVAPALSDVPLCSQINERAQLGTLSEDDRQRLRTGRCR